MIWTKKSWWFGDSKKVWWWWFTSKNSGDLVILAIKSWWFGDLQVKFQLLAEVGSNFIKMKVYPLIWASLLLKQRENWWWWFKPEKVGDLVIWVKKSWWFGDSRGGLPPFLHTGTGKQFRRGYCRGVATYSIHPFFLLNIQLFRSILGVNTIDSFFSCILRGANTIDIQLRGGKYSRQPSLGGQIQHFHTPCIRL